MRPPPCPVWTERVNLPVVLASCVLKESNTLLCRQRARPTHRVSVLHNLFRPQRCPPLSRAVGSGPCCRYRCPSSPLRDRGLVSLLDSPESIRRANVRREGCAAWCATRRDARHSVPRGCSLGPRRRRVPSFCIATDELSARDSSDWLSKRRVLTTWRLRRPCAAIAGRQPTSTPVARPQLAQATSLQAQRVAQASEVVRLPL